MDTNSVFAVQVAATKSFGGIETAVKAYGTLFSEIGIESICLYRGSGTAMLSDAGLNVIALPNAMMGLLRVVPGSSWSAVEKIRQKAKDRQILFIIHSDRALFALRRSFPDAWFIAPCHSDKATNKKKADLAITLNAKQQALVMNVLAKSHCRAVQLGNPFKGTGEAAPKGDKLRFVFCARFTETKNPLAIIKAHAVLDDPPELVMIGDGPLMDDARNAAGGNVQFLGWRADPWREITQTDILVTPSFWEGLPYMILEALDRRMSVIASDIAGHRAALGDDAYGTLFPLEDHNALVAKLTEAIAKPESLREKAVAGQKSVPERFAPTVFWHRLSDELSRISSK